jgi:hypothetical protein
MRLGSATCRAKEEGGYGREKRKDKEVHSIFKYLGTKGDRKEKIMRTQMR